MKHDGVARVDYIVNGLFIGSRMQYCCGYRGEDGVSRSAFWPNTAYICSKCGVLWAREWVRPTFDYTPIPPASWVVEVRRCQPCGDGQLLVGKPLDGCSTELLTREFYLLLERETDEQTISNHPHFQTPPSSPTRLECSEGEGISQGGSPPTSPCHSSQ